MKVLLLADVNSVHTQKWALGLAADNIEVGIFSFTRPNNSWYKHSPGITCLTKGLPPTKWGVLNKLAYLLFLPKLIGVIFRFKPMVLHAHYASSYGLLGAFSFFKPFMLSAWGSDLLVFPKRGVLQKLIIKFVLYRAQKISVTSAILANEVSKYTSKKPFIIPFGINLNEFYQTSDAKNTPVFTFGCIKHLEAVYNIDKVVMAFDLLTKKYPDSALYLKLIGDGKQRAKIENLVKERELYHKVLLLGHISHSEVPVHLNNIDVLVNVSEYESFGVSVAEAMACKVPVIVSNSEGFKDLVPQADSAFVTPTNSPHDIFLAMENYFLNQEKRETAAKNSYELILSKFNWVNNLRQMEQVYSEIIATKKPSLRPHFNSH